MHVVFEACITNKLLDTGYRITLPEFDLFCSWIALFIKQVSLELKNFACPFWTCQKLINGLKQFPLIIKARFNVVLDLEDGHKIL